MKYVDRSGLCSQDSNGNIYDDDTSGTLISPGACGSTIGDLSNSGANSTGISETPPEIDYDPSWGLNPYGGGGQSGMGQSGMSTFIQVSAMLNGAGQAPGNGTQTPKICGGTFTFAGKEVDAGEAGGFVGGIHEYDTVNGNSAGVLTELWGGGEGGLLGGGKITSTQNSSGGYLGFTGVGLSGVFAGIQIGLAGGSGWSGLYVEGHLGPVAIGTGAYLSTSCKKGG